MNTNVVLPYQLFSFSVVKNRPIPTQTYRMYTKKIIII